MSIFKSIYIPFFNYGYCTSKPRIHNCVALLPVLSLHSKIYARRLHCFFLTVWTLKYLVEDYHLFFWLFEVFNFFSQYWVYWQTWLGIMWSKNIHYWYNYSHQDQTMTLYRLGDVSWYILTKLQYIYICISLWCLNGR